jgi:CheY-like chemotaxis protein
MVDFRFLEGGLAFLQSGESPREKSMRRSITRLKSCVTLASFALMGQGLMAMDLESVYQKYLQGNYIEAQSDLDAILGREPNGEELLEMKKRVGARALLEMSQNQFLSEKMQVFNAVTWQKERSQFKSPRRIKFFIENFMRDDSTHHKSLPNILASGSYAVPFLIDYLKVDNEDIETRTLAYQILLNMGHEAAPALRACTLSDDPMLQLNSVRLLGKLKSHRSVPYFLRLRDKTETPLVKEELEQALAAVGVSEDLSAVRSYIDEANRYLAELDGVPQEALAVDRVLWTWDDASESLMVFNPLGLNFEYRPQVPLSMWGLLRAELMHLEFGDLESQDAHEAQAIQAASLCTWVIQEHRVQELLKNPDVSGLGDTEDQFKAYLEFRSQKLTVAHWVGQGVLLQALDMAHHQFSATTAARIYRMMAGYQPVGISSVAITSFLTGEELNPLIAGLTHREELIRYWAAVTISRCDKSLELAEADLVVDLLSQAIDEVGIPSVVLVSKPTPDAEKVAAHFRDMGYLLEMVDDHTEALTSLRTYPSKDMIIIDPDFGYGDDGLDLVNDIRLDPKGKDLPIVILSDETRSPKHVITYQEQAQQLILGSDSIAVLKSKIADIEKVGYDVTGPDMAADVSFESLNAIALLEIPCLANYPNLVPHLINVMSAPYQPEAHQIMAIRGLRKLGPLAAAATSPLLAKLDEDRDLSYQLVVLHALLKVSASHESVRAKLYSIVTDPSSPDSFKQMAASYLSQDGSRLSLEERTEFRKTFFSSAFLNDSGS